MPEGVVGASLSGGIDSSLVVALASRLRKVHTFSISFGPELRNELEWSSLVAKHCGAHHQVIVVGHEDVRRLFDTTVAALSEPNGDPLTVPNAMIFDAAATKGFEVVINGEGGDPSFGGPKNAPMLLSELYAPATADSRERAYLHAHQKMYGELDQALCPEFLNLIPKGGLEALVTPWFEDRRWPAFLNRLMAINIAWKGPGHILAKVEHLAARSGLKACSPLFDRRVVDLAFAIPAELKRNGPIEKYLLKEAVRDLLPTQIIERPKSGMMVPVEDWFQGPLKAFAKVTSQVEMGGDRFLLRAGSYFVAPEPVRIESGLGLAIIVRDYRGLRQWGGPIETKGRLQYIDGCTDTLVVSPPRKGEPCLNHLHVPAQTNQLAHTHTSARIGVIIRGKGRCQTQGQTVELSQGLGWYIPANLRHCFVTTDEALDVLAWHPDSDFGPTDDNHPMINKTVLTDLQSNR